MWMDRSGRFAVEDSDLAVKSNDSQKVEDDDQPYLEEGPAPDRPIEDPDASDADNEDLNDEIPRRAPVAPVGAEDTWACNGITLIRYHAIPRLELYVPTESECPLPLDYLDVMRETETDLDRLGEAKVEDFWIADDSEHSRELSWWWTGSTTFHLRLPEAPPGRTYSVGDEIKKVPNSRRPPSIHHEQWPNIGEAEKKRLVKDWNITQTARNKVREKRGLPEFQPLASRPNFHIVVGDAMKKLHPDTTETAPEMACISLDNDPLQVLPLHDKL